MDKKMYKSYTNILFPKSGFVRGMARVFDLFGALNNYNTSESSKQADSKAIYSDWISVGNDLRNVFGKYKYDRSITR